VDYSAAAARFSHPAHEVDEKQCGGGFTPPPSINKGLVARQTHRDNTPTRFFSNLRMIADKHGGVKPPLHQTDSRLNIPGAAGKNGHPQDEVGYGRAGPLPTRPPLSNQQMTSLASLW
jgi:hypothetical protein